MSDEESLTAAFPMTAGPFEPRRRAQLSFRPNPARKIDSLNMIAGRMPATQVRVILRYVPGKLFLEHRSFDRYLTELAPVAKQGIEELAYAILDDLNNEMVPRWIEIIVELDDGNKVLVEDRQPGWDNPALLSRLARF